MGHSVYEDLLEIQQKHACLYNVTEANLNLMRDQLQSHPFYCELKQCSIRFILMKYVKFLESISERINSHYYEFEKACDNFDSEILLESYYSKKFQKINKQQIDQWEEYSRNNNNNKNKLDYSESNQRIKKSSDNDSIKNDNQVQIKEPIQNRNIELPCTSAKAAESDFEQQPIASTPNNVLNEQSIFKLINQFQMTDKMIEEKTNNLKDLITSINQINAKESENTLTEINANEKTLTEINPDNKDKVIEAEETDLNNNVLIRDDKAPEILDENSSDLDENIACLAENRKILKRTRFTVNSSDTSSYKCYVSHVDSPFLFWIQLRDDEKVLKALDKNLTKFYKSRKNNEKYKLSTVVEGYYYAACFTSNRQWYRAKVLKLDKKENEATVFYIDHGNTEKLPINQIRILSGEFYNTIAQAKPVSLSNAYPISPDKEWHELETKCFSDLVLNRCGEIKLKFVNNKWPIFFCNLTVSIKSPDKSTKSSKDALEYLINENIACQQKNNKIAADFKSQIEAEVAFYGLSWSNPSNVPSNTEASSGSEILKIKPKDNNLTSLKRSKTYSVCYNNFATSYNELPNNKIELDDKLRFAFKLVQVNDPSDFYINDYKSDELYIKLDSEITDYYSQSENILLNSPQRVDFLKNSTLCIVKSTTNELFYRAVILSHNDQSINAYYIDYGFSKSVSISNAFPFLRDFCYLPPYCIACTLQSIKPEKSEGWCSKAIDVFNRLALIDQDYEAKASTVSFGNEVEPVKPGVLECSLDTKIGLFFIGEDQVIINQELLKQKLGMLSKIISHKINHDETSVIDHFDSVSTKKVVASKPTVNRTDSSFSLTLLPKEDEEYKKNRINEYVDYQAKSLGSSKEESNKENVVKSSPPVKIDGQWSSMVKQIVLKNKADNDEIKLTIDDPLDSWDPIRKHYESIRNSYGYNEQSYENHKFGYETTISNDMCRTFQKHGKCYRPRCPFIHQKQSEELISSSIVKDKKPIFSDVFNDTKFARDDLLLIQIVSYNKMLNFHAIVLGYFDNHLKRFVSCNHLNELDANMKKYYGNKKFLEEKTSFYQIGQIIAAKCNDNNWFRARVIDINKGEDLDDTFLKVFLLDIGLLKIVKIKDIYPINKRFCNQPLQSIQFELTGIKLNDDLKSELFKLINNKKGQFNASVIDSTSDLLHLVLYKDSLGNTINKLLTKSDLLKR